MAYTQEQLANMSDEDLMNLDASTLAFNAEEPAADEPAIETDPAPEAEVPADEPAVEVPADEDDENADNGETDPAPVDESDPAPAAEPEVKADKKEPKADEPAKAEIKPEAPAADEASIKSFYDKVTAPFKANGREMQVATAEEAVQLMQMGANYSKKMAALKPNLTIMKSLEAAGLMKQETIDFMIDVMAKKPEAISKLVQEAGIDPLDISADKAGEYRPTSYKVSDKAIALDDVLDELKGSDHYARTLGIVAETLDEASKQIVADNPQVLKNLHQHIADGVFDQVWTQVERQKTFGKLNGLTDLEAYRQVGEQMASSGQLKLKDGVAPQPSQPAAPAKVVVPPKPKQAEDSDRRSKRQAASPTKTAAPSSGKLPADFNPLAMSDEDILKLDISKFA